MATPYRTCCSAVRVWGISLTLNRQVPAQFCCCCFFVTVVSCRPLFRSRCFRRCGISGDPVPLKPFFFVTNSTVGGVYFLSRRIYLRVVCAFMTRFFGSQEDPSWALGEAEEEDSVEDNVCEVSAWGGGGREGVRHPCEAFFLAWAA